ncbi:type II secretion system protein E (GspE) [Quadrisphaera granulorum]|uniref:Type II secretion system protein E (GspE) n=1 Tax=Quadrisphaera granulorum TaxID=317664 RepID=A0A316AEN8_9ACTN|nr:ATPase, T2SS/T4P/T4SS family [Quadrisphaera granulorum]PWJ56193.1 type II secretion system protein E (GspE) [Quadrisphaera granulorum]SZE94827.1 type II secretion system protein E (GspE) [Quadrisphaera granulorum]
MTTLRPAHTLSSLQSMQRRRIGDVLVDAGVLSPEQLAEVLASQQSASGRRRKLGELLVESGITDEKTIARALADQLGLTVADLSRMAVDPEVVRSLPRAVAERTRVVPLERTSTGLVVAVADPTNVLALDDVRLHTGSTDLVVTVATESQVREQLARAWALDQDRSTASAVEESGLDRDAGLSAAAALESDAAVSDEDSPVVKLVNRILSDAVRARASDIHVETQRDELRVRFRVDGMLREVMSASKRAAGPVISRIKIMSGLDIAERRVPQDGRSRVTVDGSAFDCRVSTLPTLHGEKVVIRLLTRGDAVPSLDDLGFSAEQLAVFRKSLSVPQGLVLITGPTGSGKTNTLYSALAEVLTPEKNIITLEDPVEVQLAGITQVQVNVKTGMTFQAGLRSVLRQDPDIVLVGEVRDSETAELALKASLTGHLVLTTLHTNSAVAALTRLVDMGVQPFLVASSLTAAIAQRLVRKPCRACAAPYDPPVDVLRTLGLHPSDLVDATPRKGTGCPDCGGTGYNGRTAVYEVLEVDAELRRVLVADPREAAVAEAAAQRGMLSLRDSAVRKALAGETTFEEALRVTASDDAAPTTCHACERTLEEGMIACPWCGTSQQPSGCVSCHRSLRQEWTFCPWCSTAVAGRTPAAVASAAEPTVDALVEAVVEAAIDATAEHTLPGLPISALPRQEASPTSEA